MSACGQMTAEEELRRWNSTLQSRRASRPHFGVTGRGGGVGFESVEKSAEHPGLRIMKELAEVIKVTLCRVPATGHGNMM